MTLIRYPDGVEGEHFYEKHCPSHRPEWVRTGPSARRRPPAKTIDFCLSRTCRRWSGSRSSRRSSSIRRCRWPSEIERPTVLAFDLDPGPPATIVECCRVALLLRELFAELRPRVLPEDLRLEGHAGLRPAQHRGHLRGDEALRASGRPGARAQRARPGRLADDQERCAAARCSSTGARTRRRRRRSPPTPCGRASAPTASTPLSWDEVSDALDSGEPDDLRFEAADVLERVERSGDLFAPVLELEQELPA